MFSFFHNHRGETLIETLIALSILAIGITFSGTLMATSLSTISNSKNQMIAINIARAGLEATRNIRDTNWLKFSGNRRACWNHQPAPFPDSCDGSTPVKVGEYIVYQDENNRWRLRTAEQDGAFDNRNLFLMDIDAKKDTDKDGDPINDTDLFNHQATKNNLSLGIPGEDPLGYTRSQKTIFKRWITIDYLDNQGVSLKNNGGPLTPQHNRMVVTSTVKWISGAREIKVEVKTYITDYLGRDNLDS